VKKIKVVGYDFDVALDGGLSLHYDWKTDEWSLKGLYFSLDADLRKYWDKGFEILGFEFTAGVHVGSTFGGTVKLVEEDDDWKYSGIIRLGPYAGIHADVDLQLLKVWGDLTARLPAEFHFPTGYIGVDITFDASIKASALGFSGTIYEENFAEYHWDNGREKVVINLLGLDGEYDQERSIDFQPMGREYAQRESIWLGSYYEDPAGAQSGDMQALASPAAMGARSALAAPAAMEVSAENPEVIPLMGNIYPEAQLAMAANGDRRWVVWNDDNKNREAINRTQLRVAEYSNGLWSMPEFIFDDGTADFDPAVAAVADGILIAWNNIGREMSDRDGLADLMASSEISVSNGVYVAGSSQPDYISLTNDDKIDHSPRLASNGEKALLVWTKSEDAGVSFGGMGSSEEPGDYFWYSIWNGSSWSEAEMLPMAPATIIDSYLVMDGDEALLLYTIDSDNDFSTGDDREVFARIFDGSTWGAPIQLTVNELPDYSPKAVRVNGEWFITWIRGDRLVYQTGLAGETKEDEKLTGIQSNYKIAAGEGNRPLVSVVYTLLNTDNALDINTSLYDFNTGKWIDKKELKGGGRYSMIMSPAFTVDGRLLVAYTQADIITVAKPYIVDGEEKLIETKEVSDKVYMEMLMYTPVHDMALLDEEGIFLSNEYPLQGTVTIVYTNVHNRGYFAESIVVELYDGDPQAGGVKVAESAPRLIEAHTSRKVEIYWPVEAEVKPEYNLYAVVRISDGTVENNYENNQISLRVITPDVAIASVTAENAGADNYLIDVTVVNSGGKTLENVRVWLEDETGVKIQDIGVLQSLDPGEEAELSYILKSNGRRMINVRVAPANEVIEGDTDNNVYSLSLEPESYYVIGLNIYPGATQVPLDSSISLMFNMPVGEGEGFGQITLFDPELNEVPIDVTVRDINILNIQPQQLLEYGTRYRLAIPEDALGDAYGHTLESELEITFITVTTSPEIVSAYPSENMNGFAPNETLYLRYNQTIVKNGDSIVLREQVDGAEAREIPVRITASGELLTIQPYQRLTENGAYALEIPRGAVINQNGEASQKDYVIRFTTGEQDGPSGGNPGEEPLEEEEPSEEEPPEEEEPPSDQGKKPSSNQGEEPSSNYQYEGSLHLGNVNKSIVVIVEDEKVTL